jgi:transcriptional regulator with XRE-family HTH domain
MLPAGVMHRTQHGLKMPKAKKKPAQRHARSQAQRRAKALSISAIGGATGAAEVPGLSHYAIGTRLRHARLMRGSRLKDVANAAGCSESLVSKIENNKVEPSLQVLHKLCSVLKIGLGELFSQQEEDSPVVTRAGQRSIVEMDPLRRGHGILMERVIPYAKGHLLQSNIHIVAPGGSSFGLISHEGEEVGYLIAGEIELFLGDKAYQLSAGDTFCFRSEIGHGYRNRSNAEARILFVNTPPTF